MKLTQEQQKAFYYLADMIKLAAKDNDYDCLRSNVQDLTDIFSQIPEQW